eukprot:15073448-Ditylum_brightwellii.AAC.1
MCLNWYAKQKLPPSSRLGGKMPRAFAASIMGLRAKLADTLVRGSPFHGSGPPARGVLGDGAGAGAGAGMGEGE